MAFSTQHIIYIIIACLCSFCFCVLLFWYFFQRTKNIKKSKSIKFSIGIDELDSQSSFVIKGLFLNVLKRMNKLSIVYCNSKEKLIITRILNKKKLPNKIQVLVDKSNFTRNFNNIVYRETQLRYLLLFVSIFAVVGFLFSTTLMLILIVVGIFVGYKFPVIALKKEKQERTNQLEKSLPEMLDVICLGLRSGMTFDRSLKIFTEHFDTEFSENCKSAQIKWENGICSREEALRKLSDSYDSQLLNLCIENIIRSLRFGSSMVENLQDASVSARKQYRSKQEEVVAKAPVKMMLPTGTLILPAMLLLVLGPVILELVNGL